MERKDVCELIRKYNLGEEVKARFGDNYTHIPTKKLEQLLWDFDATLVDCPYTEEEMAALRPAPQTETASNNAVETDNIYEAACLTFLGLLKDGGLLDSLLAKL